MTIVLDGTNGINTPDLESAGPVVGTTGTFSGNVTLGTSVLATPTGSAPSYTCRAWVNFNGTGTVAIRASGNVSSITDNGLSDFTINLTTAMPDTNYAVFYQGSNPAPLASTDYISARTTSSIRIVTYDANGANNDPIHGMLSFFR